MKKYIIASVLVLAAIAYYIFAVANHDADQTAIATPPTTDPAMAGTGNSSGLDGINPGTGSGSGTSTTSTGSTSGTGSTTSNGKYKDGTYTGSVADAFYGNLQVKVTIAGGKITNVAFLQYPQGGHSSEVSNQALPLLAQEAITAQSSNVNVVSGATQDSEAFDQTMASALAQAKA